MEEVLAFMFEDSRRASRGTVILIGLAENGLEVETLDIPIGKIT
jgi:hypothetical protein